MITERPIEPPEPKDKCFIFTCDCSCKAEIVIYAENIDEAREGLNSRDWDDKNIVDDIQIEDELDYKVED